MKEIPAAERANWRLADSPAALFIEFWSVAAQWTPADRAALPSPTPSIRAEMTEAFAAESGGQAVEQLTNVLAACWPSGKTADRRIQAAGLVLEAMHIIDKAFEQVHPRSRMVAPSLGATGPLPTWLETAERLRLNSGSFAENATHRLIPNGPFSRHGRGRSAASGDSLQDHFPFLTVASRAILHEGRVITINMRVIGTDISGGVPAARSIGRERIRFIPLAEDKDDLSFTEKPRGEQQTLDVRPKVELAARLLQALRRDPETDLAFAPELTFPVSAEGALPSDIAALAKHAPRIILAGSGLTSDTDELGRHWNEARVYARGGRLLWRQRKIWPFGMQRDSAISYALSDPGHDKMLMEDIAGHSEIEIADLDGFGRCIVLVCQDFECNPLAEEIIRQYQPDWVLVPILDPGVKVSGWAHQRGFFLSKKSQARLLIGSSLTMARKLKSPPKSEPAVGLAIGPSQPREALDGTPVMSRAMALVAAGPGSPPRSGILIWDYSAPPWSKSSVEAT